MAKHPPLSPDELPDWPEGDPREPLLPNTARVWLWSIDGPAEANRSLLAGDEIDRADRFRFEADRRHFTNARAGLRRLLASSAGVGPESVTFRYAGMGKPALGGEASGVTFNLSHSAGVAVAVLGLNVELGVDVEAVRPVDRSEGIARRYFSPGEVAELFSQPPEEQDAAFFRFWTNKEAVVKLLGSGITFPLPSFTTPLCSSDGQRVPLPADNPLRLGECWVKSLHAGEKLRVSVCAPQSLEVKCLRLPSTPV